MKRMILADIHRETRVIFIAILINALLFICARRRVPAGRMAGSNEGNMFFKNKKTSVQK